MKYFKLDMGKKDLPDLFATFHEYEEKIERKHMPDDKYPCLRIQVFEPDSNGELDRKKMVAYAELHLDVRAMLAYMYVKQKYQSHGLGQRLLDMRMEYARNLGFPNVQVVLQNDNKIEKRKHFFEKRNGFEFYHDGEHWVGTKKIKPNTEPTHETYPPVEKMREIAMKENLVSTAQRTLVRDDANGKAR